MRRLDPLSITSALGAGLAFGALLWFAGLAHMGAGEEFAEIAGLPASSEAEFTDANPALPPLFTTTPDPSLKLIGISRAPNRAAALVEVNGSSPVWMVRGSSLSGVTLIDVSSGQAVVESVNGRRALLLGQLNTPAAPADVLKTP